MLRPVKIILLSVFLVGCYSEPYHRPHVEVINKWSVKDKNVKNIDSKNIPYIAWWRDFKDPVLNQLIERGLISNTSLGMSRGSIEAAEGELKKIRYQWVPTLDLMTGYSRNPATGFPGVLIVFIPNYTINIINQIREQKRAKYTLAQVKAEDDALKLTIISQIAASYFTYLAEIERKEFLQTLANDLTQLAKVASKVYQGGLSSEIEQEELYSQVNLIQGELEVTERNIVISRNALRYLLNQNPGEIKTVKKLLQLKNHNLIPGSLPLTVLENRPDMQVAENRLRASHEGIGVAESNLLPTIQLDYIGGLAAGDSRYALPKKTVKFNDQLLKAPIIDMPVLGAVAKAKGVNKVSYYNYIDTLQKALRDTTNALSENERLTNKLKQTASAQKHLAKAYNLNDRLYQTGIQSYIETLNSKISLDKINISLNQDKLQELLSIVRLYQELAGGYRAKLESEIKSSV
ncbi:TPA: TolC family protein [Legionella pneumophila]|uniref:TolC family protein n=1 Tax=Legionella sp. PATHC039 TaxID=2992042 RepID=UPI001A1AA535|nr:TolC family protein [Legionella sp. PATHC039]HAT8859186.1 transporter [Legionella pneumophila subsp. pneumophila]HEH5972711.1 TolC family protein [Legionella pneumophila]MCW8396348.1 TolC family protein [Legionella sp. PATHC039]HAT9651004.1 transporter [Legionella pneumophila subsp. pneumophila]HAT9920092.1 transporter [Legionella pneumophila subsp. pneumophila]